jgi:single-stranded DNA-binding protein
MGRFNAVFDGGVVAEPERIGKEGTGLGFPVYIHEQRKNKDTGDYEDTGNTAKIQVALWGDLADEDVRYGDIVEVDASLTEREYEKKDGSKGRQLQTAWVNSVVVKYRKGAEAVAASGSEGLPW